MRRKRLDQMQCSIAKALDVVGDPWTMLVLRDALVGVTRFEDFVKRLGIPRATLASRLDHLCATGVFERHGSEEHARRHEYRLTDKGLALRSVVLMLMRWGDQWTRDDEPPTTLVDRSTGALVEPVVVDRSTGRPLDELDVVARGPVTTGLPGSPQR